MPIAYGQQWSESTLVLAMVNHDNNNSIIIVALVCLTTSLINLSLHGLLSQQRAFSFEAVVNVHTCASIQLVGEIINAPKACIRAPMVYSPPYSEDSAHRRLLIIPTFSPPWQAVPTMFIASTISQTAAGIILYTHNTSVYEGLVQAHIISSWYSGDSIHMHVHMSHISCTYICLPLTLVIGTQALRVLAQTCHIDPNYFFQLLDSPSWLWPIIMLE